MIMKIVTNQQIQCNVDIMVLQMRYEGYGSQASPGLMLEHPPSNLRAGSGTSLSSKFFRAERNKTKTALFSEVGVIW